MRKISEMVSESCIYFLEGLPGSQTVKSLGQEVERFANFFGKELTQLIPLAEKIHCVKFCMKVSWEGEMSC